MAEGPENGPGGPDKPWFKTGPSDVPDKDGVDFWWEPPDHKPKPEVPPHSGTTNEARAALARRVIDEQPVDHPPAQGEPVPEAAVPPTIPGGLPAVRNVQAASTEASGPVEPPDASSRTLRLDPLSVSGPRPGGHVPDAVDAAGRRVILPQQIGPQMPEAGTPRRFPRGLGWLGRLTGRSDGRLPAANNTLSEPPWPGLPEVESAPEAAVPAPPSPEHTPPSAAAGGSGGPRGPEQPPAPPGPPDPPDENGNDREPQAPQAQPDPRFTAARTPQGEIPVGLTYDQAVNYYTMRSEERVARGRPAMSARDIELLANHDVVISRDRARALEQPPAGEQPEPFVPVLMRPPAPSRRERLSNLFERVRSKFMPISDEHEAVEAPPLDRNPIDASSIRTVNPEADRSDMIKAALGRVNGLTHSALQESYRATPGIDDQAVMVPIGNSGLTIKTGQALLNSVREQYLAPGTEHPSWRLPRIKNKSSEQEVRAMDGKMMRAILSLGIVPLAKRMMPTRDDDGRAVRLRVTRLDRMPDDVRAGLTSQQRRDSAGRLVLVERMDGFLRKRQTVAGAALMVLKTPVGDGPRDRRKINRQLRQAMLRGNYPLFWEAQRDDPVMLAGMAGKRVAAQNSVPPAVLSPGMQEIGQGVAHDRAAYATRPSAVDPPPPLGPEKRTRFPVPRLTQTLAEIRASAGTSGADVHEQLAALQRLQAEAIRIGVLKRAQADPSPGSEDAAVGETQVPGSRQFLQSLTGEIATLQRLVDEEERRKRHEQVLAEPGEALQQALGINSPEAWQHQISTEAGKAEVLALHDRYPTPEALVQAEHQAQQVANAVERYINFATPQDPQHTDVAHRLAALPRSDAQAWVVRRLPERLPQQMTDEQTQAQLRALAQEYLGLMIDRAIHNPDQAQQIAVAEFGPDIAALYATVDTADTALRAAERAGQVHPDAQHLRKIGELWQAPAYEAIAQQEADFVALDALLQQDFADPVEPQPSVQGGRGRRGGASQPAVRPHHGRFGEEYQQMILAARGQLVTAGMAVDRDGQLQAVADPRHAYELIDAPASKVNELSDKWVKKFDRMTWLASNTGQPVARQYASILESLGRPSRRDLPVATDRPLELRSPEQMAHELATLRAAGLLQATSDLASWPLGVQPAEGLDQAQREVAEELTQLLNERNVLIQQSIRLGRDVVPAQTEAWNNREVRYELNERLAGLQAATLEPQERLESYRRLLEEGINGGVIRQKQSKRGRQGGGGGQTPQYEATDGPDSDFLLTIQAGIAQAEADVAARRQQPQQPAPQPPRSATTPTPADAAAQMAAAAAAARRQAPQQPSQSTQSAPQPAQPQGPSTIAEAELALSGRLASWRDQPDADRPGYFATIAQEAETRGLAIRDRQYLVPAGIGSAREISEEFTDAFNHEVRESEDLQQRARRQAAISQAGGVLSGFDRLLDGDMVGTERLDWARVAGQIDQLIEALSNLDVVSLGNPDKPSKGLQGVQGLKGSKIIAGRLDNIRKRVQERIDQQSAQMAPPSSGAPELTQPEAESDEKLSVTDDFRSQLADVLIGLRSNEITGASALSSVLQPMFGEMTKRGIAVRLESEERGTIAADADADEETRSLVTQYNNVVLQAKSQASTES